MRWAACLLALLTARAAYAQAPADPPSDPVWHGTVSVLNLYDGNINHELNPTRSVGIVPAMTLTFASSDEPTFTAGYEIASNSYSGTDEWDRISHSLNAMWSYRLGTRLRFETGGASSWKGSSEDRELANEFGVSQRAAYRMTRSTRVIVVAAYRYKQYPDDPGTSGPSPYVTTKLDRKLEDGTRFAIGYKYQTRRSHAERDRYRRSAYMFEYSRPVLADNDRFALEAEYRQQRYERSIKVDDHREWRSDRRVLVDAVYERPLNNRTDIRWMAGVESRSSNDPDKRFFAPALGMNLSYRLR